MFVLPVGPYAPVGPIAPRKTKAAEKRAEKLAATRPTRSATAMASHAARTALDEIKLGG